MEGLPHSSPTPPPGNPKTLQEQFLAYPGYPGYAGNPWISRDIPGMGLQSQYEGSGGDIGTNITPRPIISILNRAHGHSHTHHIDFEPGPWDSRLPRISWEAWDILGYPGHGTWFKIDIVGLGVTLVPKSPPDPLYRL